METVPSFLAAATSSSQLAGLAAAAADAAVLPALAEGLAAAGEELTAGAAPPQAASRAARPISPAAAFRRSAANVFLLATRGMCTHGSLHEARDYGKGSGGARQLALGRPRLGGAHGRGEHADEGHGAGHQERDVKGVGERRLRGLQLASGLAA